ncbi:hypothetical protein [Streptomyces griseoaurantiacus]|uniref:hypothetical protein n=1 Tax=Streptomyces griseoaurantiacus TaxID=68213 RepID=UPI002E27FD17|nr:hypothetical protein [Streptomyces jietaisiensis]
MTKSRFDHSNCQHEKTKAGRAACRKALRAAAEPAAPSKTTAPKVGTTTAKKTAKKAAPAKPAAPKKSPTRATAPAKKAATSPVRKTVAEIKAADTK